MAAHRVRIAESIRSFARTAAFFAEPTVSFARSAAATAEPRIAQVLPLPSNRNNLIITGWHSASPHHLQARFHLRAGIGAACAQFIALNPLIPTLVVLLLASLAEWRHVLRIRAAGRLAFGPAGVPNRWTLVVPFLRPLCLAAFAWGLATLWLLQLAPAGDGKSKGDNEATRLVFVADLSPSMYLQDAGPEGKQTRQARMREVVEGILQRVSGNLRFGVIGFYTESLPVVMEARDPELVRNVFNGLPLTYAMPLGQTDLGQAVNEAIKHVSQFPEGSTRLIFFTDGDSVNLVPILPRPKSVKEVFVLGLGNLLKGSFIDGHLSRQEAGTLRAVATSLRGTYVDVNEKHLATSALGDLVVTAPLPNRGLSLSEVAVLAMALGAAIYALIPVALEFFGTDWKVARAVGANEAKEGVLIER